MKKGFITALIAMALGFAGTANADVVSEFESKVAKIEKFASTPKVLLHDEAFSGSPTGMLFYLIKYTMSDVSYDVKKSDSLVSPYIGYVTVQAISQLENRDNGDTSYSGLKKFYSTSAKALTANTTFGNEKVYSQSFNFKYTYAYQRSKWVLKGVSVIIDGRDIGHLSDDFRLSANSHWLIK